MKLQELWWGFQDWWSDFFTSFRNNPKKLIKYIAVISVIVMVGLGIISGTRKYQQQKYNQQHQYDYYTANGISKEKVQKILNDKSLTKQQKQWAINSLNNQANAAVPKQDRNTIFSKVAGAGAIKQASTSNCIYLLYNKNGKHAQQIKEIILKYHHQANSYPVKIFYTTREDSFNSYMQIWYKFDSSAAKEQQYKGVPVAYFINNGQLTAYFTLAQLKHLPTKY